MAVVRDLSVRPVRAFASCERHLAPAPFSRKENPMKSHETTQPTEYTKQEKQLAEAHGVEPKMVKLIKAMIRQQHEPPEESSVETIDEQTQCKLLLFYERLDRKSKLALAIYRQLLTLDGHNFEADLFNRISEIVEPAIEDVPADEEWLTGVWESVRMVNTNI